MEKYYYAFLLLASIAVPMIRSFEPRIRFWRQWPAMFAGIFVMMLVFIPWDIAFTRHEVWSFNYNYVLGFYISNLPVEEWLFFVVITYCIVFSYEVLRYFFPKIVFPQFSLTLTVILGVLFIVLAVFNTHRLYTLVVMSLTGILALLQPLLKTHKTWLTHFFLTYLIMLAPFLLVNGALTGSFTEMPVVSYDDTQNFGIRIFTIPIEDSVYLLGMMFITFMVYERVKKS